MKTRAKRLLCLCLALLLVLGLTACGGSGSAGGKKAELLSMDARPDAPSEIPEGLDIDWNYRYTFAELEGQLARLAETYPDITNLYSIGTSWQERDLWCMELTNKAIPAGEKTGIGVFANIHGGERESASSAMYTAWWLALCSGDDYVKGLLDNYIIYVIPVINPDGYEQSFVINNRPNLRPRDANGDNIPYSDPSTPTLTATASSPRSIAERPMTRPPETCPCSAWKAPTGTKTAFWATIPARAAST